MKKPSPFVDFKEIKQAVSITEILEHYDLLETFTEKGDGLVGACPIHEGTSPTQFRVTPGKNIWYCFGRCQEGGNALDFVAKMEEVPIHDAALLIAEWFDLPVGERSTKGKRNRRPRSSPAGNPQEKPTADHRDEIPPPSERAVPAPSEGYDKEEEARQASEGQMTPKERKKEPEAPALQTNPVLPFQGLKSLDHGHEYLTTVRGFKQETMEHFGVGYFTGRGLMAGRIAIPIHNRHGDLVAYAGRSLEDGGYRYPPNFRKELELYNLHRAAAALQRPDEGIVIVPDLFDVFRLYEAGYENAVAITGEEISREQLALLLEAFGPRTKATLFFPEGSKGAVEILSKLIGMFFVRLIRTERAGVMPADLAPDEIRELLQ